MALEAEVRRIKSIVADVASKAFTGKTIEQRVNELFKEITPEQYEAGEQVWNELYQKRIKLHEALQENQYQIKAVEEIIGKPIKE